jgi:multidrug efflux pump
MFVFKSPDANIIQTVDKVYSILPLLRASISPAIKLEVVQDHATTIRASVHEITISLMISICLVIIVVFVFLREIRSTLIPSVSVPLSLLGTCGFMYLAGYTVDNLSLMALTVSTGFVIDDAIVVIENITRHLEKGLTPFHAAMVGSREIGFTVLSMSISLVAVFIPILMMGGQLGRMFREFACTLSAAIFMSLVVSLTTTPMLSAKFLQAHTDRKRGLFYRMGDRAIKWLKTEYGHGLSWVLNHQKFILSVTIITCGLSVYLYILIPKGFFPQQDTGRLSGNLIAQQDISFIAMRQKAYALADIIDKDPGIQYAMAFVGSGSARMFITLQPADIRKKSGDTAEVIINRLRPRLSAIPGATMFLQSAQEIHIGGRGGAAQYQYTLTSDSLADLETWTPLLMTAMQKVPEIKDINTDQQNQGLREQLVIDRDTASRLGITPQNIDDTLDDAFGQRQVSTIFTQLNQYHVVLEVAPRFQLNPSSLDSIYVRSSNGTQVPLSTFTHFEPQQSALSISHQGQFPAVTVSFDVAPGKSIGDAVSAVNTAKAALNMPASVNAQFQGTAAAFEASLTNEPLLILAALITVYIVLGVLYESYIHPITILSTLPSAGVGAILALILFHIDLSVIALIGIILLIGIVKKNAIMMIDFALEAEREGGKSPEDAIYQACLLRFRPIMMTTMAALLGGVPLALGTGSGSELRRPLGISIVGGLLVSQVLTLYTTPVVYLFFDRLGRKYLHTEEADRRFRELEHETVEADAMGD